MLGSPSEPGIIPLAVDELFSHIHHQQSRRSYSLRVSFLEIYNEQLRDLLAPPPSTLTLQPAKGPEIVENGVVKNLEERAVSLPEEVLEVLKRERRGGGSARPIGTSAVRGVTASLLWCVTDHLGFSAPAPKEPSIAVEADKRSLFMHRRSKV